MSQNVDNGMLLRPVAEVSKRLANGGLTPAQVQAMLEGVPSGESSLDHKIVVRFNGFGFTEANFSETIFYSGTELRRHRLDGGWVPVDQSEHDSGKAWVEESVYVGPRAMVLGSAKIYAGDFHGGTFYGGAFEGGVFLRRGAYYGNPLRVYQSDGDADNATKLGRA